MGFWESQDGIVPSKPTTSNRSCGNECGTKETIKSIRTLYSFIKQGIVIRGAPQNDSEEAPLSFRVPLHVTPSPLLSFRTAVRNLRSPSDGQSITTMSGRVSSILDSSSCAPQNDRGEGAPQNDTGGGSALQNDRGEGGAIVIPDTPPSVIPVDVR